MFVLYNYVDCTVYVDWTVCLYCIIMLIILYVLIGLCLYCIIMLIILYVLIGLCVVLYSDVDCTECVYRLYWLYYVCSLYTVCHL